MGKERRSMEIKVKPENYLIVPIEQVSPNTWNPKNKNTEEYNRLRKAIQLRGQIRAIHVREVGTDKYEIIDGEQRYTALKEEGYTHVLIYNEGVLDDQEARERTAWFQAQVPFNEVDLAYLVRDLVDSQGLDNIKLPYSDAEIQRFLKLSEPMDFSQFSTEFEAPEGTGTKRLAVKVTKSQYDFIRQVLEGAKMHLDPQDQTNEGNILVYVCDKVMEKMNESELVI